MIQAVAFDVRGVLYDFDNYGFVRNLALHSKVGEDELYDSIFNTTPSIIEAFENSNAPSEVFCASIRKKGDFYLEDPKILEMYVNRYQVNSPVHECVESIHPSYKRGAIFDGCNYEYIALLGNSPLLCSLDATVRSHKEHTRQPDERMYGALDRKFELGRAQVLYVTGNKGHRAAAEEYGFEVLSYENPKQLREEMDSRGFFRENPVKINT